MSIEIRLNDELKTALKARDSDRAACIRQVRAKCQEAMNAPDFDGVHDDAFYVRMISGYAKSLQKSIKELEPAGERSQGLRDRYAAEVAYLASYLPQRLSEEATRSLLRGVIEKVGATKASDTGKVMSATMKDHRDEVDAQVVKRILSELLPESGQDPTYGASEQPMSAVRL